MAAAAVESDATVDAVLEAAAAAFTAAAAVATVPSSGFSKTVGVALEQTGAQEAELLLSCVNEATFLRTLLPGVAA